MKKSPIIQLYDRLDIYGGAQKVIELLHEFFLGKSLNSFVSGLNSYDSLVIKNKVSKNQYIRFNLSNLNRFKSSIVISHSRKMTTALILLNKILKLNCKIIHVAHSIFNDKKLLTLFPKNVIAVSEAVKENLVKFFGLNPENIRVIYNGIPDLLEKFRILDYPLKGEIRILYIGRIDPLKQQCLLVKELRGKLRKNIKIHFVGNGDPSYVRELQELILKYGSSNFKYLGFIKNVAKIIPNYHYVLLFSKKEGFGLSLVESCMMGRPVITRGVGECKACSEICVDGYNGFIINDIRSLQVFLNNLDSIPPNVYNRLCKNARYTYEVKFSLKNMLYNYEDYLRNLIKEGET